MSIRKDGGRVTDGEVRGPFANLERKSNLILKRAATDAATDAPTDAATADIVSRSTNFFSANFLSLLFLFAWVLFCLLLLLLPTFYFVSLFLSASMTFA